MASRHEGVARHEGVPVMNRCAFAFMDCVVYSECNCRSKARRRESRVGGPGVRHAKARCLSRCKSGTEGIERIRSGTESLGRAW